MAGCRSPAPVEEAAQPFVFRSLNLRQQDAAGRPLWELTSPETRYDLSRRVAQSRDLKGVLYSQGKPAYRFTASNGVVLNDGEVVQLEGPTRVQRLDPSQPLVLTAQRVRWYPARKLMELDRSPVATQSDLRLTSQRVRFLIDQDRLELRGSPRLIRQGEAPLQLEVTSADWLPGRNLLRGQGPVVGERTQPDRTVQTLTAPSFTANTSTQTIELAGPILILDPARKGRLELRSARLDLLAQVLTSADPFSGTLGQASLMGTSLRLDLQRTTAQVNGDCRLTQTGDRLSARRCLWNWRSGRVEASGGVELQRKDNNQITRSARLVGRAAKDGFVQFGGSGERVTTQIQLPEGRQPSLPGVSSSRPRPPIGL